MKRLMLLALVPLPLFAQKTNELNEVVISDNRIELAVSEAAKNVTIITREQIEQLPAQNLNELLQLAAGVDVRQRGAWGMQADVSLRGGTFEQALILVNGVKMNDPQTGHHNLNLGISPSNIERIEVIKGPAASRYGLNSFSGVINIVTKPSDDDQVEIRTAMMQSAGEDFLSNQNGGYMLDASVNFGVKKTRHNIAVNRTQNTGYRANTDFIRQQVFYQGTTEKTKAGQFGAMASYLDNNFGASGFYAYPADSASVEAVRTGFISLNHELQKGKFTWKTKSYWRNNFDEYTFVRTNPSYYQNRHTTNVFGGETHLAYNYKVGTVATGVEYRNEGIRSTNLGNHNRDNFGVFAENRLYLMKQKLQVGTGFYLNQSSDYGVQFLPSVEASYSISESVSAFANYGTSFRVPSFTDLYYVGPVNIGNNELKPEQAVNYEAGAKYIAGVHHLQASVFFQQSNNLIDWVKNDLNDPWMPQNFEDAETKGVDINYVYSNLNPSTALYLSSFRTSYTYLDMDLIKQAESNTISRYALTNLNHQLSTQIAASYKGKYSLTVSGKYFDRVAYKDYWIVDARLMFKQEMISAYLDISNALNTEYIEAAQAPMPGRWARIGLNVLLK